MHTNFKQSCTVALLLSALIFGSSVPALAKTDYKKAENWAFKPTQATKPVDVFFLAPAVYRGKKGSYNMSLKDKETKQKFVGAINMEKGIYDQVGDIYAPYYSSVALAAYELPTDKRQKYTEKAYKDVKLAFDQYLTEENKGRPLIIAGFSQGSEMALRLLKDMKPADAKRVIATYAIGWPLTKADLQNTNVKAAKGAKDTGVVISFNSEDPKVFKSAIVPSGTSTIGINPLNWRTDSQTADKWHNKGAVFADYTGNIKKEVPYLTGAYLSSKRGTLKVTNINPVAYPAKLPFLANGVYHIYDYQFFYRNLQANVADRVRAFMENYPYGNRISQWYTNEARTALADIRKDLTVKDYHLKLTHPRDIRMFTDAIVVHHTGSPTDDDWTAPEIHRMHLNNGWYGIGYHFVIRKNGTVELGTPLETIGAHSYDHNTDTIGIHLSGNFELVKPTAQQIHSLEQLIADLATDYHLPINAKTVAGHQHFNSDTACPGYYLERLLPTIRDTARAMQKTKD